MRHRFSGLFIGDELQATKSPYVIVDASKKNIDRSLELLKDEVFIEGDATDIDIL